MQAPRAARAAIAAIGLAVVAVFAVAGPASAHNQVVSSTPAPGATLTTLPATFGLTTNLALLDPDGSGRGFALEIRDAAGRFYEDGCITITDATMTTPAHLGAGGAYTMIYQLVSADGHTVSGEIPFTWSPPTGATPSAGSKNPATCPGSTVKAQAPVASNGGSDATRGSTVPLGDVLFIGGVLVAMALAVVVTLVVLTRRRRDDEGDDEGDATGASS